MEGVAQADRCQQLDIAGPDACLRRARPLRADFGLEAPVLAPIIADQERRKYGVLLEIARNAGLVAEPQPWTKCQVIGQWISDIEVEHVLLQRRLLGVAQGTDIDIALLEKIGADELKRIV